MIVRSVPQLIACVMALGLSANALADAAIPLTLEFVDTTPTEQVPDTFLVNVSPTAKTGIDKVVVFTDAGAATLDLDYEVSMVQAEKDGSISTETVIVPHLGDTGVDPGEPNWTVDGTDIVINKWSDQWTKVIITLIVIDDAFDEGVQELASFELRTGSSALKANGDADNDIAIDMGGNGTVTIVDNDEAGFQVTPTNLETAEDNTDRTFTVSLTSQPDPLAATVVIPLSITPTGTDPVLGSILPATQVVLDKDNWQSGATVTVKTGGGSTFDPDETFTVVTGDPGSAMDALYDGFAAGDVSDVDVVDLNDDQQGTIRIDVGDLALTRNEGDSFSINVQRANCAPKCSSETVAVEWRTVTGTADASDFDPDPASPNGTLTWTAGSSAVKTIPITITDDSSPEPAESFTVVLSNVSNATLDMAADTSTITIPENDQLVTGNVIVSDIAVDESVGNAVLTLQRVGSGSDGKIVLDWVTMEGDGAAGDDALTPEDYAPGTAPGSAELSGSVTWNDGASGSRTVSIPIVDDSITENDEFFRVEFSLNGTSTVPSGFTAFDPEALVKILANDATGNRGQVEISNAMVVEGNPGDGTMVTLTVVRTVGTDGPVTVNWMTAEVTATTPEDYADPGTAEASGTISWLDGETGAPTTGTITIPIAEDTVEEPAEFFKVQLTVAPESACTAPGAPAARRGGAKVKDGTPPWCAFAAPVVVYPGAQADHARVDISDDDAPGDITLVGGPVTVGEGAGMVNVVLNRGPGTQGKIVVDYQTVDGDNSSGDDAAAPADYTGTTGSLTWDNVAGNRTISIPIIDDAVQENAEFFRVLLTLGGSSDVTPGSMPTEVLVQIIDNDSTDPSTVNTPATQSISENAGVINATVTRVGTTGIAWVDYTTQDGTGVAGVQYTATSGTVQMADGQAFATVSVPIIADANSSNENFFVKYTKPATNNAYTLLNDSTTVNIIETAAPAPGQIIISKVDATEGSPARVRFTRVNGTQGTVVLNWSTADDTAGSSGAPNNCAVDENSGNTNDYVPTTSGQVTWNDGDSGSLTQEFAIPTIDDLCIEGSETFDVNFSLDGSSDPIELGSSSIKITIIDNDGGGNFSITDVSVTEDKLKAILTVSRQDGSQGFVFLQYQSADGTAFDQTSSWDYDSTVGSLTWDDGDASDRTITVYIRPDNIPEPDEVFTVTLFGAASVRPIEIIKPTGVVTIMDPVAIPTLSQWALMLLVWLMAWIGYRRLRPVRLQSS